ncbi:MAG: phage holin family protein [Chloroflexi bacterium]|nr:MAG: phage holin family protein [Chloroflexota bacterium]TMG27833.1 MAG: phage holin family protein [Chloroflexota bacterium]
MATQTEPKANGSAMKSGVLAAEVVHDLNRLVSLEIELAKQELKELAVTNGIAAACFAFAGILAGIALLVAVPVIVVVAVPWHWQAAVVWAVAYALIAAGLAIYGRMRLRVSMPQKTITSLKETKEWALQRMKSAGR